IGVPTGPWNLMKQKFPGAIGSVGAIYADISAARDNYLNVKAATEGLGYKWVYSRGIQPTETDFTADVVRMRQAGVKFFYTNVEVKTIARIAKAMQQQAFTPQAFVSFGAAYDASLPKLGGDA